jgi:hypothetical protein
MNSFPQPRFDVGADLDRESEEILEFEVERSQIEQTPPSLHVDQQIDVTPGPGFATDHGPIDPQVRGPVAGRGR